MRRSGTNTGLYKRARRGMTLLEIMIVIAILGLIASVVVVSVMGVFVEAKIKTANLTANEIAKGLLLYKVDNGRYPTAAEGLGVLELRQTRDPWGGEFEYREIGREGGMPSVSSRGPDRQAGTEDDISVSVGP